MVYRIISVIAKVLNISINEVEMDTAIGDLPEWDSLHHMLIIAELEKIFDIKFSQDDLKELEDVSDLVSLVKELM